MKKITIRYSLLNPESHEWHRYMEEKKIVFKKKFSLIPIILNTILFGWTWKYSYEQSE
jgi:hypothetical protein